MFSYSIDYAGYHVEAPANGQNAPHSNARPLGAGLWSLWFRPLVSVGKVNVEIAATPMERLVLSYSLTESGDLSFDFKAMSVSPRGAESWVGDEGDLLKKMSFSLTTIGVLNFLT